MNQNSIFDDDFDDAFGAQPSGYIHTLDTPDVSQSTWYDLEEEKDSIIPDALQQHVIQRSTRKKAQQATAGNMRAAQFPSSSQHSILQKALSMRTFIILGVLFVALVGSVAFAKSITPPPMPMGHKQVTMTLPTPMPTVKALPTPTPTVKAQPTPTPTMQVQPTPTSSLNTGEQMLAPAWIDSGRGNAEALEALSIATTFTQRYETLDYRSPATLTASLFIVTPDAKARFLDHDKRNTHDFAHQLRQQKFVQAAFVTGATLVKAQKKGTCFYAWISVSYQLVVKQAGQPDAPVANLKMSILLKAVPFNTPQDAPAMGGIGWLVSNYAEGDVPLDIAN